MKFRSRQYFENKISAEINMTNLVDVTLVLLIIFILVAPVMEQGISLQLPKTSKHQLKMPENVIVSIGKKGEIYLDEDLLNLEELHSRLKIMAQANAELPVIIRADKQISYQKLMEVLDKVRSSGLTKLGMATDPE